MMSPLPFPPVPATVNINIKAGVITNGGDVNAVKENRKRLTIQPLVNISCKSKGIPVTKTIFAA